MKTIFLAFLFVSFGWLPISLSQQPAETARARSLLEKAEKEYRQGHYQEAVLAAQTSHDLFRKNVGERDSQTWDSLLTLGKSLAALGETAKGVQQIEASIQGFQALQGESNPKVVLAYLHLGMISMQRSEHSTAVAHFRKGLAAEEKIHGPKTSQGATILQLIATNLQALGKLSEAHDLYSKILEIQLHVVGPGTPEIVDVLERLCSISIDIGALDVAKDYGVRALELQGKLHGVKHVRTADIICLLGLIASREERYDLAKQTLREGEEIYRELLDEKDTRIAKAMIHRGQVHRLQGDFKTARDLFRRAAAIYAELYGEDQSTTAEALYGVAETSFLLKDFANAIETCDRARRITRNYMGRVLPYLSETEQLDFIEREDKYRLDEILSASRLLLGSESLGEISAGWVINSQGIAQEALTEQYRKLSKIENPETRKIMASISQLRQRLTQATLSGFDRDGGKATSEEIQSLNDQVEKLSNQLASQLGTSTDEDLWVELDQVRSALEPRSVILQFAKYDRFDFETGSFSGTQHYMAWVIPKKGSVTQYDLGEAEPIDQLIGKVRSAIAEAGKPKGAIKVRGEETATNDLRPLLQQLHEKTLAPMEPHLKNINKVILCPDGSLWLSPWGALTSIKDKKFLIERLAIQMMVSPRLTVDSKKEKSSSQPPIVFANPQYDLAPASVWKNIVETLRQNAPTESERQRSFKRASIRPFANVAPLPNTAIEAEMITPSLKVLAGQEPRKFLESKALESVVRKVQSPSVLFFGTHGFFLQEDHGSKKDSNSSVEARNPMTQCGLLLAGCKDPNAGRGTAGDDGVLTGMEITELDLRGTQLVILSACETGVGRVRNGEGVASLCQAFQLAGAETVVSTLWAIPDRDSVYVVSQFTDEVAKGKGKAEAMRSSQMQRIEKRRERFGDAHPYYWSGFTINGL